MEQLLWFSCSFVSDSVTPWTAACQDSLSFTIFWSLLKLMFVELVMPSNHLVLCYPLLLLPSIFPCIMDWFKIGKGVHQGCILSPCLFNLHAEYIMRNARLDKAQTAVKVAERNISNLRYADTTTLMTESKEELKSLLTKVKEESEKSGLKLSIKKT